MPFSIKIDDDMRMGAQRYMYLAPDNFTLTAEGTDIATLTEEQAEKFAWECPNMAIVVEHAED